MPTSRAVVATSHASRYLQQLCKHWAHKFEVEFTPQEGRIALPRGVTKLKADESHLAIELEAPDAESLPQLQDVVARHIERFAFRETLAFEWT